jgi:tetratricopeptide (TPR) repeat protein
MKSLWIGIVLLTVSIFSWGQTTGAAGAAGATTGSTGSTAERSPEAGSSVGKDVNGAMLQNQGHSGDYLNGTVSVQGNPLLWDPIPVTIYCDGKSRAQAYVDTKGHFQFQSTPIGGPAVQQAKKVNLTALYTGCTVKASLAGYQSSSLVIANRNLEDNPDVGTLKLTVDEHANGSALSATSASAPKNAVKAFEKAREDMIDRKPDKAKNDLQKAVQQYPQFAMAWYELGMLQAQAKSPDARNSLLKAVAADPKYLPPYLPLAQLSSIEGKWQDVQQYTQKSLALNPEGSAQVWYFDALAKYNLNDKKGAEASGQKAFAMDPNHTAPNTEQLLAVLEAGRGDYTDALAHLKNSLTYLPPGQNADLVKQQISQLETAAK